jgi:tRNA threonylcarbamoyladenosine biosynthesis protein TsaB
MRLLALDTATEGCSAALLLGESLLTREAELSRGHAEHILPMVDELLSEASVALRGLDAIAFGRGPGSFTGVRLAASIAQGLAFGAGLGVVPVSDLAALAQRALDLESGIARLVICSDARMNEVYWACFERGAEGLASAATPERVGPTAQVSLPGAWTGAAGAGRGFAAYPELRALPDMHVPASFERLLPRAAEVARLAVPLVRSRKLLSPHEAIPIYLRDEVARPRAS